MSNVKVKFLKSCAGIDFSYTGGTETEIPADRAVDLLRAGYCVKVEPVKRSKPKSTAKAKPSKVENAKK